MIFDRQFTQFLCLICIHRHEVMLTCDTDQKCNKFILVSSQCFLDVSSDQYKGSRSSYYLSQKMTTFYFFVVNYTIDER